MTINQCGHCGKKLDNPKQKFCTLECENAWELKMQERMDAAVKNDSNHTNDMVDSH